MGHAGHAPSLRTSALVSRHEFAQCSEPLRYPIEAHPRVPSYFRRARCAFHLFAPHDA